MSDRIHPIQTRSRVISSETRKAAEESLRLIELSREKADLIVREAEKAAFRVKREAKRIAIQEVKEETVEILLHAHSQRIQLETQFEDEMVSLSIKVAEKLLHTHIKESPDSVLKRVEIGLTALRNSRLITLRMNQDDHIEFMKTITRQWEKQSYESVLNIVSDSTLNRGECIFSTHAVSLDMTFEKGLELIRDCLLNNVTKIGVNND